MAKPPIRKPKKKVCLFCQEKITHVDYKTRGCCASSSLTAARSGPTGFRQLHAAPARCRHGDQELARDGAAAVHQPGTLILREVARR